MANLSEVFIAALRLAAALFGTNKDHANSSSQAPEPSQAAAQEASRPSTSGRSASNPKTPAKSTASRDVHISGNQVWDVARRGLPEFSYQPVADNDADPGEVVWTWVPYQEDASVGKDRPAVVIGAQGEGVYLLQLTSKDHTREAAQEAAAGRYWFDIGTGAWDSKGRPSKVRLDRALWVKATDVRREGSILPEVTWRRIVDALEEHYRTHGE